MIALQIFFLTVIWGYTLVLMKIGLDYMGPLTFSAIRFFIGFVAMFFIFIFRKIPFPRKEQWPQLAILGLLQKYFPTRIRLSFSANV
ncbi:hypothetical protein BSNK01_07280 [Bacillaceae bacterium]